MYEKEIGDNSCYVVQAVPKSSAKTLYVVSAFIGEKGYKKEAPQLINAQGPDATSKIDSADASNRRVADSNEIVNTPDKNSSKFYSSSDTDVLLPDTDITHPNIASPPMRRDLTTLESAKDTNGSRLYNYKASIIFLM